MHLFIFVYYCTMLNHYTKPVRLYVVASHSICMQMCALTRLWLLAEMILVISGSHNTRSASEPTAMWPLRGYRLKIFAALVLVTATNWFSSILPVTCKEQCESLPWNWKEQLHSQELISWKNILNRIHSMIILNKLISVMCLRIFGWMPD